MRKIQLFFLTALVFLLGWGGVALAADAADPADGSLDVAKSIYDAFAGGHYAYAAALGVILAVALVKRYLGPKIPWLHSDAGGSILTLLASGAGAMSSALAAPGATVTFDLLKTAVLVGIGAAGGFTMAKHLLAPLIQKVEAKLPAWAKPICSIVLWIFDKPDAVSTAEQAGIAAVAANPAGGVAALPTATANASSTVGAPVEVK